MKFCRNCGAAISGTPIVCPKCGDLLSAQQQVVQQCHGFESFPLHENAASYGPKKTCRYCKEQIDKKAKNCPYCQKSQGTSPLAVIAAIIIVLVGFQVISAVVSGYSKADQKHKETTSYSESEYKNLCRSVTYEQLARDKDMMLGDRITVSGQIVQVTGNLYRIEITKTDFGYTDAIAFEFDANSINQNILVDDIVTIWGVSDGKYTYKTVLGDELTVPKISAYYLEISQ